MPGFRVGLVRDDVAGIQTDRSARSERDNGEAEEAEIVHCGLDQTLLDFWKE